MNEPIANRFRRYWRRVVQFSRLLLHHFVQDGGAEYSASLTYTTLLSLVPLMTVLLALFSVYPASDQLVQQIETFVFENFLPTASEVVHEYLSEFSHKAARLTGFGFLFLLLVALLLMANIDMAFNKIWHVRRKRRALTTFMVYWSILSLGPILIATSVGVTSYLVSIPVFAEGGAVRQLSRSMLAVMPIIISALAFTLLYALVPNRVVPLRHAAAGGVLAALLFEAAKSGFALYVAYFPTYEAIYGAVAVVPIFLIWIYLSWLVTLLGAEFTYCLGIYRDDWHQASLGRGSDFLLSLRLLRHLRRAQQKGRGLDIRQLVHREPGVAEEQLENILERLQQARMVFRTEDKAWMLARNLHDVKLWDLYQAAPFVLPDSHEFERESAATAEVLSELDTELRKRMQRPLEAML